MVPWSRKVVKAIVILIDVFGYFICGDVNCSCFCFLYIFFVFFSALARNLSVFLVDLFPKNTGIVWFWSLKVADELSWYLIESAQSVQTGIVCVSL